MVSSNSPRPSVTRSHSLPSGHQWTLVAMGLKGAVPYFQRSMQTKVLHALVCIDDVLTHGKTNPEFPTNTRRVFDRLCDTKVAVNPRKTELGLEKVKYVGHLVSTTGTSFTPEKRLKVLDFPQPTNQKAILQSIGLANYFRDHVSNMNDLVRPFQVKILLGRHQRPVSSSGRRRASSLPSYVNDKLYRTVRNSTSWQIIVTSS